MNKTAIKEVLATFTVYQGLAISIIIFVTVIYLLTNYFLPNLEKVNTALHDQEVQNKKLQILSQKYSTLSQLDKNQEIDTYKKTLSVLPDEKDAFSIFDTLDYIEKASGVLVTNSSFRIGIVSTESALLQRQQKTKYFPIDIIFNIIGTKEQIITLLESLASFKSRLLTARDIKLDLHDASHMEVSFLLSAYYLPLPEKLGAIDAKLPSLTSKQVKIKEKISQNAPLPNENNEDVLTGKTNLFQ